MIVLIQFKLRRGADPAWQIARAANQEKTIKCVSNHVVLLITFQFAIQIQILEVQNYKNYHVCKIYIFNTFFL